MESAKISEREARLAKLHNLIKNGVNPFPASTERTDTVNNLLANFDELEASKKSATIVGRLRGIRAHGNLTFTNLEDGTDNIQLAFSKKNIGNSEYKNFIKVVDIGDFIQVKGKCFNTHKNEKTLMVDTWQLLAKAIRPLPEKWHGLQDEEEKLRKRYLDILFDPELKKLFYKKAKFWQSARDFFISRGFIEVETPVLENTTGGADARPFITHHNALNSDVYLRISMGELWQKRLMVAGFEKTFEIGRQFRNEGMDAEHLQDYTQLEFYWAYADFNDGMSLVEEFYKHLALTTFGTLKFKIGTFEIDLEKKWEKYDYTETIKKYTDINIETVDLTQIENKLKELKIEYDKKGFNITRAIDNLWKYCRRNIAGPGFLVNLPAIVSPLAKRKEDNPNLVQKFQPIIAGSELGNGYSELNDPIDQAARFAEQAKLREQGDEEAQMNDTDFVEALEYGMPPTCGFGMSERVFAFLANRNMRECQIFPLMKPKESKSLFSKENTKENDNINSLSTMQAYELLNKYVKETTTKLHSIESEAIMRALAKYFNEDEDLWGVIGLLHDIDWDLTKNNPKEHGIKAVDILTKEGVDEGIINAIISHNYGYEPNEKYRDKKRSKLIEHCLAAAETLTGIIVATALVQADKKLSSVKLSSLQKKFMSKNFAANCSREIVMECEKVGLDTNKFLEIGLISLQEISDKINL